MATKAKGTKQKKSAGSYAERARQRQKKRAEKAAKSSGDPREWTPTNGTHKIRVLPPLPFQKDTYNNAGELVGEKGEEDDFFYMTHAYHFFENIGTLCSFDL